MFFAFTVLTTIGYGDYTPVGRCELDPSLKAPPPGFIKL